MDNVPNEAKDGQKKRTLTPEAEKAMAGNDTTPLPKGRKPDVCEQLSLAHAWEDGPTLTVDPPIVTRKCMNCGRREKWVPGRWDAF